MYLEFSVKIPENQTGISKKKIKGTTYIYYEHGRKYYTDKRFKNMSVILNGTNKENSGYGRYGYTYDVKPNKKSRKRYKRKL